MARLIIIAGASGAGKSFLLENIENIYADQVVPVKKMSTRKRRPYEENNNSIDLIFDVDIKKIRTCDYIYPYGNHHYGIVRDDIDNVLAKEKSPFVIVRNGRAIKIMKQDYPNALVLYLQTGLSGSDLIDKMKEQGRNDIEIDSRMKRFKDDYHDYIRHSHLFDHVLINYYESDSLIDHFTSIFDNEMEKPIMQLNYFFVIMSFREDMQDYYNTVLKNVSAHYSFDIKIERIDLKEGDYQINDEILASIERAEIVICDLTHERPNVYFELGYSKGRNKKVIMTAKKGTKIHFNIHNHPVQMYRNFEEASEKIIREIDHYFNTNGQPSWRKK